MQVGHKTFAQELHHILRRRHHHRRNRSHRRQYHLFLLLTPLFRQHLLKRCALCHLRCHGTFSSKQNLRRNPNLFLSPKPSKVHPQQLLSTPHHTSCILPSNSSASPTSLNFTKANLLPLLSSFLG